MIVDRTTPVNQVFYVKASADPSLTYYLKMVLVVCGLETVTANPLNSYLTWETYPAYYTTHPTYYYDRYMLGVFSITS